MSTFVVSRADAGDFDGERLAWDVLHRTAIHRVKLPERLDLSNCLMLKPYAIACLVALGAKSEGKIRLQLPTDARCAEHLVRHGVNKWFELEGTPAEVEPRESAVVVRQLTDRPEHFADEAIATLTGQLGLAPGIASELANNLDEVILNALTHSDSPIGCVVAGQAFPTSRRVEFAIVDLGQTIRGHLSSNPKYESIASDSEAIIRATEEGVTGTVALNKWNEPNSGIGLFELRKYCEGGGGCMAVLSGGSFVTMGPDNSPRVHHFRGFFAGCLVNVQFFLR